MKYLQIHVLIFFIPFMLLDAIEDVLPSLIMLSGKKIQENETTFYQLNCSSVWNPLGKSAEFIVNRKTVDHLSVFNDTCSNSVGKECNVNVISNCYCIPDKNIFIIKLKERSIDENIFSCQMRFKDARNENIIRAIVSIAFNGTEDQFYEYDVKLVGNKLEDENKNITNFKENSENLELWLPVGFSIGLIVLPIVTLLYCFCRRKCCRKSAETTKKESLESPEGLDMKTVEPLIDKTLQDDLQKEIRKELHRILEDIHIKNQKPQRVKEVAEDCGVDELLAVRYLLEDLHEKAIQSMGAYEYSCRFFERKRIIEILEILEDQQKKIILSFRQGELQSDKLRETTMFKKRIKSYLDYSSIHSFNDEGNISEVRLLTRGETDDKSFDLSGNTVVHLACTDKEGLSISSIISRGYDINIPNNYKVSPLMVACSKGKLTTAKLLINAGADFNAKDIHDTTVFHCACAGGDVDIIDILIEKGCTIHKPNENGITPLMVACSNSHLSIVKRLITTGANVNENDVKGNSVFHWACAGGDIKIVNLLIEKKCEINKPNVYKITPLMIACSNSNFSLFKRLIENGAKHNAKDVMGDTVFHYSCAGGNNDIIDLLIDKQCEIDKPNNRSITPLMVACAKGNLYAVIKLILSGANFNACDLKGRTVLHWSFASGNDAISEVIVAVSDKKGTYKNLKQKVTNLISTQHQPSVARRSAKETDFSDLIGFSQLYWSFVGNLQF